MIHLNFALSLEQLANSLTQKIQKVWTSPFQEPVIIFPDHKVEEWFWLNWVKEHKILASLKATTLDKYLFSLMTKNDENKKLLSAEMLRHVMIAYLLEETDGKKNYELLGDEVVQYLEDNGELNELRLFDFANKMAALFLEYERSRPSNFLTDENGILDCWKEGNLQAFFKDKNGDEDSKDKWQRELYSKIFHTQNGAESLLSKVFHAMRERTQKNTEYLTLPYLFNEGKANLKSKVPVFIFGLSGMGQFYRVILQEFAKENELYAYIQNPCMEFWEDIGKKDKKQWRVQGNNRSEEPEKIQLGDCYSSQDEEKNVDPNENALLAAWGRSGRENVRLWCAATDYDFNFEGNSEKESDSLLYAVQNAIAERKPLTGEVEQDESLTLTAAPSKLREVENLHTQVCRLLKKGVRLDEMLVVSPNLGDYYTEILQVFSPGISTEKNEKTLQIPYSILDFPSTSSMLAAALDVLLSVRSNGSFGRQEFFALARNPVVQQVRGIHSDEVDNWVKWIEDMHVYREKNSDWTLCEEQMLLAKLSKVPFQKDSEILFPYEDIESGDDHSLLHFVTAVCDLKAWANAGNTCKMEDIASIEKEFAKWICLTEDDEKLKKLELLAEKRTWQREIKPLFESIPLFFDSGLSEISWTIVAQIFKEHLESAERSFNSIFTGGLTFMKFAVNRTLPIKHLFFLGASSDFPSASKKVTIDLRRVKYWPGDDSVTNKNRYAFLCQLMNVSEGLHFSYVNKNLKKDEEKFPSTMIRELQTFMSGHISGNAKKEWLERVIPLDESRPNADLFTLRALRNKKAQMKWNKKSEEKLTVEKSAEENPSEKKYPERVNLKNFQKFMEEPFAFYVSRNMYIEEAGENPEKESFEPMKVNSLDYSVLLKVLTQEVIENCKGNSQIIHELIASLAIDERNELLSKKHELPRGIFGEIAKENLKKQVEILIQKISDPEKGFANWADFSYQKAYLVDLTNSVENEEHKWTLEGSTDWMRLDENNSRLELFTVAKKADKDKYQMALYLQALMVVASQDKELTCTWIPFGVVADGKNMSVKISPEAAKTKLQDFFDRVFVKEFKKVMPYDCLMENVKKSFEDPSKLVCKDEFSDLQEYIDTLKQPNSAWNDFAGKNLFELESCVGFLSENFCDEWKEEIKAQGKLIFDIIETEKPKKENSTKKAK